jgi:hypothetical protein
MTKTMSYEMSVLSHVYCLSRISRMLEMVGVCILLWSLMDPSVSAGQQ